MMRIPKAWERGRQPMRGTTWASSSGDNFGAFFFRTRGVVLKVIASDGSGWIEAGLAPPAWEHVSVSVARGGRLPTWLEMRAVRLALWSPEDLVLEFHPPENVRVNYAEVLHLWRPIGVEIPLPPASTVGPTS